MLILIKFELTWRNSKSVSNYRNNEILTETRIFKVDTYYKDLEKQEDLRDSFVLLGIHSDTWLSESLMRHHIKSFLLF